MKTKRRVCIYYFDETERDHIIMYRSKMKKRCLDCAISYRRVEQATEHFWAYTVCALTTHTQDCWAGFYELNGISCKKMEIEVGAANTIRMHLILVTLKFCAAGLPLRRPPAGAPFSLFQSTVSEENQNLKITQATTWWSCMVRKDLFDCDSIEWYGTLRWIRLWLFLFYRPR